ncbi:MAG: helix-turn-helix transcriptional regulator [Nanoarchaeota archaeon]
MKSIIQVKKLLQETQFTAFDTYFIYLRERFNLLDSNQKQQILGGLEGIVERFEQSVPATEIILGSLDKIKLTYDHLSKTELGRKKVGEYLSFKRSTLGYTQDELGKLVGVHQNSIRRWENGECNARSNNLYHLFRALGDCSDFVEYCTANGDKK